MGIGKIISNELKAVFETLETISVYNEELQTKFLNNIEKIIKNSNFSKENISILKEFTSIIESLYEENNIIITNIKEQLKEFEFVIKETENIKKQIDLINNISEMTKILSLNASIESARAGEIGKGFAVIAEEIKNLSIKTKEVTSVISESIERLSKNIDNLKEFVDKMVKASDKTVELFEQVKTKIEKILKNSNSLDSDITISMISLKIDTIKSVHINSIYKFLLFILDNIKEFEIVDSNSCMLTKIFREEGIFEQVKEDSIYYHQIIENHEKWHEKIKEIYELKMNNNEKEIEEKVKELTSITQDLLDNLDSFEKEVIQKIYNT